MSPIQKTQQGSWKRRHNSKLGEQQEKLFVRLKPKAAAANVTHRKVATKEKRDQSFITTAGVNVILKNTCVLPLAMMKLPVV